MLLRLLLLAARWQSVVAPEQVTQHWHYYVKYSKMCIKDALMLCHGTFQNRSQYFKITKKPYLKKLTSSLCPLMQAFKTESKTIFTIKINTWYISADFHTLCLKVLWHHFEKRSRKKKIIALFLKARNPIKNYSRIRVAFKSLFNPF